MPPTSSETDLDRARVTRRTFLGGLGAVAGSALLPVDARNVELSNASFTGAAPVTAAMHVHASWSEGKASWEAQFAQARSIGCNLIFMTDHDFRALAYNYLPNLSGVPYTETATGSFRTRIDQRSGSGLRLAAQSANSAPAVLTATVQAKPTSWNRLRTSISGTVLRHTMGTYQLTNGATYEVVILLSQHLAGGARTATGQLSMRYRFGPAAPGLHRENSGLTGVRELGHVAPNTVQTFDLVGDARLLWPDLPAVDNGLQTLSFVVTSPRSGALADVTWTSLSLTRTGHTEAGIIADQKSIVAAYASRFPGLREVPSVEVSRLDPHVNAFGVPQFFPNQADITPANKDSFYSGMSADVHNKGGLVSWNHPFGANAGPLLSTSAQAAKRRAVFMDMVAKHWYGVDIMEVGYTTRGSVSTQAHLDLWDTFSQRGIFLTGNGVNDDHIGEHWASLGNGWATGLWAASTADSAVVPALRDGRAYTRHAGRWPNGQIDLLVDGTVRMGQASTSSSNSRALDIFATSLPSGSTVQLIRGTMTGSGTDPQTAALPSIPASSFAGSSHTVSRAINTSSSCFVRAQVRDSAGGLIGTSNPVWLLRSGSTLSIPAGRRA